MAVAASRELRVVNPATLELVGMVPATDPAHVQEVVVEARLPQRRFAEATLRDRRDLLLRVADLALERRDEIAATVMAETAKPRTEAYTTELFPALDAPAVLAAHRERLPPPAPVGSPQLL